jgi:hypothetical protein
MSFGDTYTLKIDTTSATRPLTRLDRQLVSTEALMDAISASADGLGSRGRRSFRLLSVAGRQYNETIEDTAKEYANLLKIGTRTTTALADGTQRATKGMAVVGSSIFQASQAVEDFAVGFNLVGGDIEGIQMGLRGASNNIGFIISQQNQWAGAIVTVGLAIAGGILPALVRSEDVTERINRLVEEQNRLLEERKRIGDELLSAAQKQADLQRLLTGAETKEDIEARVEAEQKAVDDAKRNIELLRGERQEALKDAQRGLQEIADTAELSDSFLEAATRIFSGGAIFGGTDDLSEEVLRQLNSAIQDADSGAFTRALAAELDVVPDKLNEALRDVAGEDAISTVTKIVGLLDQARDRQDDLSKAGRELEEARSRLLQLETKLAELPEKELDASQQILALVRERLVVEGQITREQARRDELRRKGFTEDDARSIARAEAALREARQADEQTSAPAFRAQQLGFTQLAQQIQNAALGSEQKAQTKLLKESVDNGKDQLEVQKDIQRGIEELEVEARAV